MSKHQPIIPAEYIMPLNMNKLRGRMLRMPPVGRKKREFLFVYGHHSSLERWYGVAQALNDFGGVTMPDLPGFGGMDSFYKIGEKPSLDNLADYLAAFVKLRYRTRRFTIVGFSFGFLVVTRMLQRYPELARKIDDIVSVSGFASHEDFIFSRRRKLYYRAGSRLVSIRPFSTLFRNVALHPAVIRSAYHRSKNARDKFRSLDATQFKTAMDFEVVLWRINDLRTHMYTTNEFIRVDNCRQQVAAPLWHVSVPSDRYFDAHIVEQHLNVIFEKVTVVQADTDSHSPSIIATKAEGAVYFPRKLRARLNKKLA